MTKDLDEGLTLEGLLLALKAMHQEQMIQVFFDPDTWRFYILHDFTLTIMVPADAIRISTGRPETFYTAVCQVLSLSYKNSLTS